MNTQTEPTGAWAKDGTESNAVAYGDEPFLFEVRSPVAHFSHLKDARERRYSLVLLLLLMVLTKLAGHDKPEVLADWARLRTEGLVKLLKLKRATMLHATS